MTQTKRRRGRPPKPLNQRLSHTLAIRINTELYQWLIRTSEANGRSLSEQAEVLLYGAFDAQALAHETLLGAIARGEVLLQPAPSPRSAAGAASAAEASPRPERRMGDLGAAGGVTGELFAGEASGRGMAEFVAAFRHPAVTTAIRETVKAAFREEFAAVVRDPGGIADSSKNSTAGAESTRA